MSKNLKILGKLSLEVYEHLGGLNFDEKDFQIALGYELTIKGIEYLREVHIELYYKDIPIKLGAPDFYLNREKPPAIIEIKLGSSLSNTNRQQLKMYLLSIKRNPKSVLKSVKNGILINFLKDLGPSNQHQSVQFLSFFFKELKFKNTVYFFFVDYFHKEKNNNKRH